MTKETNSSENTIRRVSQYLFKYKFLFGMTLALACGSTLLEIAVPIFVQGILDQLGTQNDLSMLTNGVFLIMLFLVGSELLNRSRIRVNNTLEQQVLMEMRRDLHAKLLHLPLSFYDQRKSGELSSRVIEDVTAVERALLDGTEQGTGAAIKIVLISSYLFYLQPFLACFVFFPVPFLLILGIRYSKRSRVVWKSVRKSAGDLNSLLVEDIQGNRLIQTFGLQDRESKRFEQRAEILRLKTLRAMFRWANYHPFTNLVTKLGFLSIVGIGGYLILLESVDFTMGKLVAFFLLSNMLYQPITQLHGLNHLIAAGRASGDRVFEILDAPVEIKEATDPLTLPPGSIKVRFENVGFQYPGRPAILEGFNLTLEPKQVTALVGHTGAGKSTIAHLAMRTYDTTTGIVKLSGVDIRQLRLKDLHDQVGYVAQDPFLFDGSVRDNLSLAKADATEPQIIDALERACAWDFVRKLPQALDTPIGEKGIRLSQGEKQRLTIARVLLKNPPFVILDEATASVDTITERKIQKALEQLVRERTVMVIAHRLSTVREADKIVVMDKGRIIESGNHRTLIRQDGHYSKLWKTQILNI